MKSKDKQGQVLSAPPRTMSFTSCACFDVSPPDMTDNVACAIANRDKRSPCLMDYDWQVQHSRMSAESFERLRYANMWHVAARLVYLLFITD